MTLGGFDTSLCGVGAEDWYFTLRAVLTGVVALSITPLVCVRKHSGNDSLNNFHMSIGEVLVLERILSQVPESNRYADSIEMEIGSRAHSAYNSAFVEGKFDALGELYQRIHPDHRSLRIKVKMLIAGLPNHVRRLVHAAVLR